MRKLILFIVWVLYTATSFGVTVRFHYCQQQWVSTALGSPKAKKCSKCGMKEKNTGCCKEKVYQMAIHDPQQLQAALDMPASTWVWINTTVNELSVPVVPAGSAVILPPAHAPPPLPQSPLFILHCCYLI